MDETSYTEFVHKHYEHILCYVDGILFMSMNAEELMQRIQDKFKFKKDLITEPKNYLGTKLQKKEVNRYVRGLPPVATMLKLQ